MEESCQFRRFHTDWTESGLQRVADHARLHRPLTKQTLVNFVMKAFRLYEQERMGAGAPDARGMYVRSRVRWAQAGVGGDGS